MVKVRNGILLLIDIYRNIPNRIRSAKKSLAENTKKVVLLFLIS